MSERQTQQTGSTDIPRLAFSEKYSPEHSAQYFHKHRESMSRRLSTWRETSMARKALRLVGNPRSVLDLPCGAGRFWRLLAEDPGRRLLAADNSPSMLEVAQQNQSDPVVARFSCFQTSAFDIDLENDAVENIFCMRLIHHVGDAADRMRLLQEFSRVASKSVVLSLWVDGNYKGKRRARKDAMRRAGSYQNRFVVPRTQIEAEFRQAGLEIVASIDFLKFYSMWRVYALRVR